MLTSSLMNDDDDSYRELFPRLEKKPAEPKQSQSKPALVKNFGMPTGKHCLRLANHGSLGK